MGGGLLERYIVHQAEMVVAKLGTRVSRVLARKQGPETVFSLEFEDGKRATMLHATAFGFFAAMAKEEGDQAGGQITSSFFPALVSDMTRFFMTGDVSFDPKETLAVMKLIDLCLLAKKNPDAWVEM